MRHDQRALPSVQVLRALAALLVLFHHTQLGIALGFDLPVALPDMAIGSAGVDIFFVVSGFIMMVSCADQFGQGRTASFLSRRMIRLLPLYWAVTLLYVLAAHFGFGPGGASPSDEAIWASFLFWPALAPSGAITPVHVVGWTLNFEMFFYALFALALLVPHRRGIPALLAALTAIVAAGALFAPSAVPLVFWSNPIILEFGLGVAIGLAFVKGARLGHMTAGVLALAAIVVFAAKSAVIPQGFERLLVWGVPAAALVAGFVLARREELARRCRSLVALGDASYALYIVHLPVLWAVRVSAIRLGIQPTTTLGAWAFAVLACAACIAAAWLTHRWFEKPVTAWLKAALRARTPAAPEPVVAPV